MLLLYDADRLVKVISETMASRLGNSERIKGSCSAPTLTLTGADSRCTLRNMAALGRMKWGKKKDDPAITGVKKSLTYRQPL